MIVDAHQHFWDPARGDYGWLTPDLPIHRVYGTADLRPLLVGTGVDATILVQAAPSMAETDYLLDIARNARFILGVVGWIDLSAADAVSEIRRRAGDQLFLGVRPMLQDLPDPYWISRPALAPALNAIAAEGLVFDALVKPHQIAAIMELAKRHPQLPIVLDHAAKPRFGDDAAMAAWRTDLADLASCANVTCKFSGLLTEGGDRAGIFHVADVLLSLFGPERLIWGSDWPVLTLAGDYQAWFDLAREAIASKSPQSVPAVMGNNALRVYRPRR